MNTLYFLCCVPCDAEFEHYLPCGARSRGAVRILSFPRESARMSWIFSQGADLVHGCSDLFCLPTSLAPAWLVGPGVCVWSSIRLGLCLPSAHSQVVVCACELLKVQQPGGEPTQNWENRPTDLDP